MFIAILVACIVCLAGAFKGIGMAATPCTLKAALKMSSNPPQTESNLDRELETFFETAAKSGAKSVTQMSVEMRAEMTNRGLALEDEIYELRYRLLDLENEYMNGNNKSPNLADEIKMIRDEIDGLKQDYVDLVGAEGLPIYFGRTMQ